MKKTFFPAHLIGTVSAPASKSEAHRRMICAGLTQGETMLTGFMDSADMAATMRCLGALGSTFNRDGDTLTISGMQGKIAKMPVMDCGESGSTLRFFVPIALTVAGGTVFRMHGRLGSRPMDVYRDLFVPRGVRWYMGVGADGALQLGGICLVAGLGGATRRDGSLAYYFSEPIVENDAKGVGPLVLAYTEMIARK